MERVFDVGHGWGGGGVGGMTKYEEREGYLGGDGESRDTFSRSLESFMCVTAELQIVGLRRAVGKRTGEAPCLIPHPSRRLLNCSRAIFCPSLLETYVPCPLSLPPIPLLSSTQPPGPSASANEP